MKKIRKQIILLSLTLLFIILACNAVSAAETSDNSTMGLSSNNSTDQPSNVVISGEVLRCSNGDPFPGVTVTASKDGTKLASTTTGEDGTYNLSFQSNDEVFTVTASYPGHKSSSKEVTVSSGQNNTNYGTVDFQLGVTITYVDDNWIGLPAGTIVFFPGDPNPHVIGVDAFATVSSGVTNANPGGTVRIADGTYTGASNTNILIDKNMAIVGQSQTGTIIDAQNSGRIFYTNYGSGVNLSLFNLTLKNGNSSGSGGAINQDNGLGVYSYLNITNCTFEGNHAGGWGGAIYAFNVDLNITNTTFTNNAAIVNGGAIAWSGESPVDMSVTNSTFTNNIAVSGNGGAIYNGGGTVTVTGSTFTSNAAPAFGGGAIYNEGSLNVNGCTFTSNTSLFGSGGAIYNNGGTLNVAGCIFSFNTATKYGGAIYNNGGTLIVTGSTFTSNMTNLLNGGAIYNNGGTLNITSSTFTSNSNLMGGPGGAISNNGTLNVTSSTFAYNSSSMSPFGGGAIYNEGTLNVNGCTFTGNSAFIGGAISNQMGNVTVTGCTFNSNPTSSFMGASGNGGAIAVMGGNVTVTDSTFTGNTAGIGGAIVNQMGTLTVANSTFTGNTAGVGGAIGVMGGTSIVTGSIFTGNTATGIMNWNGGAIFNMGSALTVTGSTFTGNTASVGSVYWGGDATIKFNRIVGNNPASSEVHCEVGTLDATLNWWGSNSSPVGKVSAGTGGTVLFDPWIVLTITANPTTIANGGNSQLTADLLHDSTYNPANPNASYHNPASGHVPDIPVTLTIPWGSFTNPAITHSITEDTVEGLITAIFYANEGAVNSSYNPVKVTATADGYTTNNTESAYITINKVANISITKTSPATIIAGNQLTYTITITNSGPDPAEGVTLDDNVPLQSGTLQYRFKVNDDAWSNWFSFTNPLRLDLGTIENGKTAVIEITGTVDPSTPKDTEISNTATADTTTTPSLKAATATTTVDTQSTLTVVKESLISQVVAGVTYTDPIYRITITNNGPSDARNVQVQDNIPGQIVNREYRINDGVWTSFTGNLDQVIAYIACGDSVTLEVRGKILSSASAGSMSNMASASVYGTTFNSNTVNTDIITSADVDLVKTVDKPRPNVGDTVTFTVTVHNYGPSDATNIRIEDLMPFEFADVIVTPSRGTYIGGVWTFDLASGEDATLTLSGKVTSQMAGKTTTNTATKLNQAEQDPDTTDSANATIYVPKSDIYIHITSNKNNSKVGETFTLTYKLGNNGPDEATNVTITIPLPEGFEYSDIHGDGNWTYNATSRTITWTFANVPVGDPYLYISGRVLGPGIYVFGSSISSQTYNINSEGVTPISINAVEQVSAASSTAKTVGMLPTGLPLNGLVLAILAVFGGLVMPKRK